MLEEEEAILAGGSVVLTPAFDKRQDRFDNHDQEIILLVQVKIKMYWAHAGGGENF